LLLFPPAFTAANSSSLRISSSAKTRLTRSCFYHRDPFHSAVELMPEELLLAALVRRAIKDAQGKQERVREEAARWLWDHAPRIAERVEVPAPVEW
jgi:hypothetical protein